jgi:hypothetical protein
MPTIQLTTVLSAPPGHRHPLARDGIFEAGLAVPGQRFGSEA